MGVSLATVIKTFIWAVMTLEKSPSRARAPLISASLRRRAAYLHFFFSFPPAAVHPLNWPTSRAGARVCPSACCRPFKSSTMDARRKDAVAISRRKWEFYWFRVAEGGARVFLFLLRGNGKKKRDRGKQKNHRVSSWSCLCVHEPRLVPRGHDKPAKKT